jgi:hypothetical protein
VKDRLEPSGLEKEGKRLFALGRPVVYSLPLMSSLQVTSSLKGIGLFQGLGKTAKESSGMSPFRS